MGDPNAYNLRRLRESVRPLRVHFFPRLGSTNDHAERMRRRGELFAPAVVLTGKQLAGRGRDGNTWWSGVGSLTATLVFPANDRCSAHQVPLIAGLAVRNVVAELTGKSSVELKWPNDLLYRGRKIAGLLCERVRGVDLVGIGLNVNVSPADAPPDLRPMIASMSQLSGRACDKTDVLVAIVRRLHPVLARRDEHPFPAILREYDRHHALRGRRVSVTTHRDARPIRGKVQGLDAMGRLLVRDGARRQFRIVAGHVQVR
jgi:BirA family biotin operon repressor/biotin-[acetyl-CoA-carboxylase] ligase